MSRVILGDIAISQTGPFGSQLHEEDYVSEGTPIVTVEHLGDINFTHQNLPFVSEADTKRLSKYILIEGDIVFSRVGSIDRNVYVDKNHEGWMFSGRCIRVRADKNKVNTRYLSYYFKQNSFKKMMMNLAVGATMPSLNTKIMNSIELDLLPRENQDKIANILSAIDDKIQINNQINQELETMAKTLYDYWFVQFDFPDQNGKPYKSSGGKMVYHPELKREIPEGWGVEKLGDISQYVSEKVDSFELNIENYVGTDNMIADMGGIELTTSIPKSGTSTKFSAGDILISNIRPYFKKIWLSDRTGGCSADVLCIRTNRTIPKEFVYATLARDDFFNYDVAGSKGSKMPRGDKKHIMEYPIVFEFGVAEQYSKIVRPIYEAVHENNNQNQELTKLRDWLLPMLMNGQVKVE